MKKALIVVFAALAGSSLGQSDVPQSIDIKNLPGGANVVEHVVIPVPSEIFNVLDRIGAPHWKEVLRPVPKSLKTPSEREQIALLLGSVIAEGFVAVEAEDVVEVKNIGNTVIKLAKALHVEASVTKRANAIIDNADKKSWKLVRKELDAAQRDAQDAMHAMQEDDLAQLVSLGGWLRGLEALTVVVKADFKKDSADLLHQPSLLDYFDKRLAAMPKKMQDKPLVARMRKGLGEIRPLMGTEGSDISEKTVGDINKIAEDLVKGITVKTNP
jgi:hypothetical protein